MNKLLVSTIALLAFSTIATGLECYVCSYSNTAGIVSGSTCNGPNPAASFLFNCTQSPAYCSTVTTTASILGVSSTTIARSCSAASTSGCTDAIAGTSVCTTSCQTDGCNSGNGSTGVKMSMFTMVFTLVVGFLFSRF